MAIIVKPNTKMLPYGAFASILALMIYGSALESTEAKQELVTESNKILVIKAEKIETREIHVVQEGENLSVIFEQYRVPLNSTYKIFRKDKSGEIKNIRPGDRLEFIFYGELLQEIKIIKSSAPVLKIPKKEAIEISIDDIFQVEEVPEIVEKVLVLSLEERELALRLKIQEQLETRMDFIYTESKKINTKKGILKKFQKMQYQDVFLSDMNGNTLYGSNDIEDINVRTIKLEQIQKVGKYGEGFIVSDLDRQGSQRYVYVKSLALKNLYIGVEFYATNF
jgi:uncharacterized protein YcfL